MKAIPKLAVIAAFSLLSAGAIAGEISGVLIQADRLQNVVGARNGDAYQDVGVAVGTGRILNSQIHANDAKNHVYSRYGIGRQSIGVAEAGGTLERVQVHANRALNGSTAELGFAYQNIGTVRNGRMSDVTIIANDAKNQALADETRATQSVGVAR